MTEIIKNYLEPSRDDYLYDPKIRSSISIGNAIQAFRKSRPTFKVGFTNGKFKVLHVGHLVFLAKCKTQCDILVVGVNSDYSFRLLKEKSVFDHKERAFCIASLPFVDYVTIFDEETPYKTILEVNPSVIFKGPDYKPEDVVSAGKPIEIIKHPFDKHVSDFFKNEGQPSSFKYFKV